MKSLRNQFERFCYQHRNNGISNLMLYITLGTAIVYFMTMFDRSYTLYFALCFDRALILQGQVWRLFTYVFTYGAGSSNILLVAISLICYYSLGRAMENSWGVCRFNLFYFTGVVLMDLYAMFFGGMADVYYLNLSLFLGYATLYPNSQFLLFFIIPVRAWIFALLDLILTVIAVIGGDLFPLVAIANYFLFFGKDVVNVIPLSWRIRIGKLFRKKPAKKTGTIPFPTQSTFQKKTVIEQTPYTHRCTVCGRTDISDPDLEFRYCSRCSGYHCYCQDHINDHQHIQ